MIARIRTLSVHEQAAWMREYFPEFESKVRGRRLTCKGVICPTPLSRVYRLVIQYEAGWHPRVFVPGSQLCPREPGEPIPHTYAPDEPCLYYPRGLEWRSDMKIALSVVGWFSLWLYYYEVWHATGEWLGGGINHREAQGDTDGE